MIATERDVLILALLSLLSLVALSVHRWRSICEDEKMQRRIGDPGPPPRRWARTDALLRRLPVTRHLAARAEEAALPVGVTDILLGMILLTAIAARAATPLVGPTFARILAIVVVPVIIWQVVSSMARARRRRIIAQLPDLVRLLAGAAKSGLSMKAGLQHAVAELGEPTSTELARALSSVEFGRPLGDALEDVAERMGSREFSVLVSAIAIQQRSGGDMVMLLNRLAVGLATVRRGQQEVRAITGALTSHAYVVASLAFVTVVMMNRLTDGGVEATLDHGVFRWVFLASAALVLAAVLLVRRIVRIEL